MSVRLSRRLFKPLCLYEIQLVLILLLKDNFSGKKLLIISVYLPPSMKKEEVLEAADDVSDTIARAKVQTPELVVFVAGDLNGKKFTSAIADYPDIKRLKSGPTRGTRTLDVILSLIHI